MNPHSDDLVCLSSSGGIVHHGTRSCAAERESMYDLVVEVQPVAPRTRSELLPVCGRYSGWLLHVVEIRVRLEHAAVISPMPAGSNCAETLGPKAKRRLRETGS